MMVKIKEEREQARLQMESEKIVQMELMERQCIARMRELELQRRIERERKFELEREEVSQSILNHAFPSPWHRCFV